MSEELTPVKLYQKSNVSVCRLCFGPNVYINIFSTSGVKKELAKKINYALGLQIEEGDGIPTTICRSCETKISGYNDFKATVENTQCSLVQSVKKKRCHKLSSPSATEPPKEKARLVESHFKRPGRTLFPVIPSEAHSSTESQLTTAKESPSNERVPEKVC